jgi:putative aldouronate transport system permease protein
LLLFALGGILKGNFGLFYNLTGSSNTALFPTTDIIETFVFRSLNVNFNFQMGSAVGLYQSLIGFATVVTVNGIVKKIEPDYSLF